MSRRTRGRCSCGTSSGEEAIRTVDALLPDLVLMDVNLPGIDGVEATRRLRERPSPPVVLLLSTYDDDAGARFVAECGGGGLRHQVRLRRRPPASGVDRGNRVKRTWEPCLHAGETLRMVHRDGPTRRLHAITDVAQRELVSRTAGDRHAQLAVDSSECDVHRISEVSGRLDDVSSRARS